MHPVFCIYIVPIMEKCLDKTHRLRTNRELSYMRENATRAVGKYCILNVIKKDLGDEKFAIITSRRFHKHAVVRNRARRLIKEAYRSIFGQLQPVWAVIVPRRYIMHAKMQDVANELNRLSQQLDILREN